MTRRQLTPWLWALAGVLAVGLLMAGLLLWSGDDDETAAPATTTTTTIRTMTSVPPTTTTTTTAPSTTTTTTVPRTTTPPKTTTAIAPVPGAVSANAHAGAGSGEVQVDWQAVRRATGYRILRTDADGRNPRIVADLDIITGRTSAASEVVNIYSAGHTYRPDGGPLSRPDRSSSFTYIDYAAGRRCYRLLAYNLTGAGPMSAVVCAAPLGDDS